jgi:RHS repeat-associated protein
MYNHNKSLNTNFTGLFVLHESVSTSSFTNRGFTGHEHLVAFGLIDMNGRVYDPVLGRFLSPDKFVQAPFLTQSFNRYSYCLNNPLKYTDPSGDSWNWPIVWAGNFLIGGLDRWINQKQPFKQAFSPANYPVVFSTNFSPGNTTKQNYFGFSNAQSEAQQIAGSKTAYKLVSAEIESARWQKRNAAGQGSGLTNWELYLTGAVLTAEDVYNNFGHNHTTYTTTGGVTKNIYKANGAVRSARAAQFARTSTAVKVLGTTGTVLMTGVATYNIVDAVSNNRMSLAGILQMVQSVLLA